MSKEILSTEEKILEGADDRIQKHRKGTFLIS